MKKELYMVVGLCFLMMDAETKTYRELAEEADLSVSTIRNLYCQLVSYPRWETIQKLAKAAHLVVTYKPNNTTVALDRDLVLR